MRRTGARISPCLQECRILRLAACFWRSSRAAACSSLSIHLWCFKRARVLAWLGFAALCPKPGLLMGNC